MAGQIAPGFPEFSGNESNSSSSSEETSGVQRLLRDLNMFPTPTHGLEAAADTFEAGDLISGVEAAAPLLASTFLPPDKAVLISGATILGCQVARQIFKSDGSEQLQTEINAVNEIRRTGQQNHQKMMERQQEIHNQQFSEAERRREFNRLAENDLRNQEEWKVKQEELTLNELAEAKKNELADMRFEFEKKMKELENGSSEERRRCRKEYDERTALTKKEYEQKRQENISRNEALNVANLEMQKASEAMIEKHRIEANKQRQELVQQAENVHREKLNYTIQSYNQRREDSENALQKQLEDDKKKTALRIEYIHVMTNIGVLTHQDYEILALQAATQQWYKEVRSLISNKTVLLPMIYNYNNDKLRNVELMKKQMGKLTAKLLISGGLHQNQNILTKFNTARDAVGPALKMILDTVLPVHICLSTLQELDHKIISGPIERLEASLVKIPELKIEQRALKEAMHTFEDQKKALEASQKPAIENRPVQ
ncbi:unnamed protein product [Caenorhabditis auriculariae]|uniref:Uncharacterized protein n=1 Tax=Caenorhabditis auriculariae TaxID=2777116 RepID=A0A8S1HXD8_9PELO|nr:unnamed protein product [Caenorhabditis auriculariae]